ncbi:hypothetical protein SAMN05660284_00648 [Formivibrio citricus]|uniref:Uncharacterized protein n=1 Tax=Formivibrio citricus TaxID=83765 RepID=A0A1I4WIY0_9NEIS|nr:hypothetical protein SAMN05660284_00648 [Formivibrio citricus]
MAAVCESVHFMTSSLHNEPETTSPGIEPGLVVKGLRQILSW